MDQFYTERIIDKELKARMRAFGAVLIVGPKGCGKTTTAKHIAKTVIEFQNEDERDMLLLRAQLKPSRLLVGEKPILFDEWQDAPKIWGTVRKSVDDERKTGMYILTGSTSHTAKVPHTGTMRISRMKMMPMSLFESGESNGTVSLISLFDNPQNFDLCKSDMNLEDIVFAICRGGWPATLNLDDKEEKLMIAKDLFRQICYVDISAMDGTKRNPLVAHKLLKSYARNICTIAGKKTICSDVTSNTDVSEITLKKYIEVLEELYVIDDIEAWCPSIRSKTAIRSGRKRNLVDPSIAVAALSIGPEYFKKDVKTLGFLFESLCIRDLKIYSASNDGELSYYRDRYGLEADAVLHLPDGRYALIEIKLGDEKIEEGAQHLLKIEELIKEANSKDKKLKIRPPDLKIILTATTYGFVRKDGVFVIPITCLRD